MAQQTVTNGPAIDGNHLKTGHSNPPMQLANVSPESQSPVPPSSQGPFLVRAPLNRSDSRQNFQYRHPFPAGSGPQSTNPQIVQQSSGPNSISAGPLLPSSQSSTGYFAPNSGPPSNSPQPGRPLIRAQVPSQAFAQRGPPLGPGGTPPRFPQGANPANFPAAHNQQQRPAFRPQTPFPRSPLLAQRPQIFQQSSVPAFQKPRATLEDTLNRSQTLDSAELDSQKYVEGNRSPSADQRPPSAASLGRSFSVSSSNPTLERKLTGSHESISVSRQNSLENVHTQEESVPPKPESRPGSRMEKIAENEGKIELNRPEPGGEVTNGDILKSPKTESPVQFVFSPSPKTEVVQEEPKKPELDLNLKSNKGDNDSGVDESTQGNDQSCNGDSRSPRKPNKSRTSSTTPTKGRSLSRGSKTPSSLQSPDSAATTPGSTEKKKVPMNKIQVGSAPSPNLKVVKSKIGSLDNAHYKPGGGKVKIESKKLDFKKAGPRIEAKNDKYVPKVGEKKEVQSAKSVRNITASSRDLYSARSAQSSASPRKIITQKLEWNAKSKIGSLENAAHKPKGGDKKIESVKLNFKDRAAPKVGSKDNIKHQPGGGDVKDSGKCAESNLSSDSIESKKIEVNVTSKVGSLDNMKHKPAGGEKKIFDDKEYLKQRKSDKSSMDHSLSGSQHSIHSQESKAPVADENLNQEH